jgi:hypothetical protein
VEVGPALGSRAASSPLSESRPRGTRTAPRGPERLDVDRYRARCSPADGHLTPSPGPGRCPLLEPAATLSLPLASTTRGRQAQTDNEHDPSPIIESTRALARWRAPRPPTGPATTCSGSISAPGAGGRVRRGDHPQPARRTPRQGDDLITLLMGCPSRARHARDTRNGVRPRVRPCPTACQTGRVFPMAKPKLSEIMIRVSGVRVPPPASRQAPQQRGHSLSRTVCGLYSAERRDPVATATNRPEACICFQPRVQRSRCPTE